MVHTHCMVTDRAALRELEGAPWRIAYDGRESSYDYRVRDVRLVESGIDFEVRQRNEESVRVVVPAPSSSTTPTWLHSDPVDAADWVMQLLTWVDEEVFTAGAGISRVRITRAGESYVVVEDYGWRVSDPIRHRQLSDM